MVFHSMRSLNTANNICPSTIDSNVANQDLYAYLNTVASLTSYCRGCRGRHEAFLVGSATSSPRDVVKNSTWRQMCSEQLVSRLYPYVDAILNLPCPTRQACLLALRPPCLRQVSGPMNSQETRKKQCRQRPGRKILL